MSNILSGMKTREQGLKLNDSNCIFSDRSVGKIDKKLINNSNLMLSAFDKKNLQFSQDKMTTNILIVNLTNFITWLTRKLISIFYATVA